MLIDLQPPFRASLEELVLVLGPLERALAMFVVQNGAGLADAAIKAGRRPTWSTA
ncbi:hypothetical protein GCM10011415_24220 [Salipiger pallidus]|uniref:Uncharacterized protein n=1 Tax=Salipiger pallidus TaxID=1775170 RepID=A0A8J2ZK87_9RHOB|nr:hypothetical protein [Salipiger pallidus]GGG74850.1 hypothetical protein GCM10011415_24220 [Salipiger pallidus]